MRRLLVLAVAACWATASAAIVDGAARVLAAADAAAAAPVAGRTLWMYWQQGEDHLKARPAGSWYSYGHRCVDYWRRLNPGYELRLLNDTSASQLSPAYRALKRRNLPGNRIRVLLAKPQYDIHVDQLHSREERAARVAVATSTDRALAGRNAQLLRVESAE